MPAHTYFSVAKSLPGAPLLSSSTHTSRDPQRVKPTWIIRLLYCLSILAATPSFALVGQRSISDFVHTGWTAKDGAPTAIQALAQTKDGLLWLGTAAGLYQFDGVTFERYDPPSWARLPAHVSCLLALPNGDLWVGFRYGAISVLRNGIVKNYGAAEGVPAEEIMGLAQDQEGTLWAATDLGLARLEGDRWERVGKEENFNGSRALATFVDRHGTLWVATEDTIEFLPARAKLFQPTDARIAQVYALGEAPNGKLWMADLQSGVRHVPLKTAQERKGEAKIVVSSPKILFDRDGALWMTTVENGILRASAPTALKGKIKDQNPLLDSFAREDGLTDDRTNAILQDREGNVWVGTRNGLDRFEKANIRSLAMPFATGRPVLAAGGRGDIWATKDATGQLFLIHDGHADLKEQLGQVSGAYRDPDGIVWWVGQFDIHRIENGFHSKLPLPKEVSTSISNLFCITEDVHGDLWLAAGLQGVFRLSAGHWTRVVDGHQLENLRPRAAFTDWLGRVWFGYKGGAVAVFNRNKLERLLTPQESSVGTVDVIQGGNGHVWLGGDLGLALVEGNQIYPVKPADRAEFRSVLGIVETSGGDLWLAESQGLVYISSAEVRRILDHPNFRVHGRLFDSLDGLPGAFRDDQTWPTEIQGTDGRIWFVTTNGIAWIDPKNIHKNLLPPPVVIRSVSANGKQYSSWVNLKLPALTRDLHIGYAGLSLSIPERVRYRYKLEGADKDWQDPGTRREAIYNSLPPGSYRFRVIACNNDGVWNEEGATLDFTISTAWYQTRLFVTCCVFAGGLLIWVLYRIRMRQMARQLKLRFDEIVAERTRIARDLHDTLVQTIHGSKMVVEDGLKASADPDRMHHALERSSLFLEQATQEARAALNSLRLSVVETNDLADAFGRALEDCRRQGNVDVSLSVLGHKKDLHPVVRDEVYRIGYEAIRNACRHSHGSRLNVEVVYSHDLTLRVADNGVGIDPMSAERGREGHYGIQGMRERAERIAAKLTIMSTTGSGTQVTVLVPGRIIFR
jgi:signal transduction histidine kinase/ligand-binding sensor domain-containing protein